MSERDFNARFPGPVTGRPRRPLSINASTASWSIRFSFRTMISGAPSSRRRFRRLFRLIILRYKSFRSDVAKRPPSSWTMGRRSGGITGITDIIIHSGRLPEPLKDSTTSSLLIILALFCPVDSFKPLRSSSVSFSKSILFKSSSTASAPMPTRKSYPYASLASWYSFSVSTCLYCRPESAGSNTI